MTNNETKTSREIITTRLIDAPQNLVWKAWTDSTHLKNWWGPNGFTNTIHTFDLKPGGKWIFTMHAPDGSNFENTNQFVEIVPQTKLVFDHIQPVHTFRVIATFEVVETRTQVTFRMIFEDQDEYDRVVAFIVKANEENFDRLETELKMMSIGH